MFEFIVVLNLCLTAGVLTALLVGVWRLAPLIATLGRALETTQEAVERASALLKDTHEQVVPVLESTKGALKSIDETLHEEVRPLLVQTGRSVAEVQTLLSALNGKVQPVARAISSAKRLPQSAADLAAGGGRKLKRTLAGLQTHEEASSVPTLAIGGLEPEPPAPTRFIARLLRSRGTR